MADWPKPARTKYWRILIWRMDQAQPRHAPALGACARAPARRDTTSTSNMKCELVVDSCIRGHHVLMDSNHGRAVRNRQHQGSVRGCSTSRPHYGWTRGIRISKNEGIVMGQKGQRCTMREKQTNVPLIPRLAFVL